MIRETYEELRLLGPRGAAFRLGYEAWNRSGLHALLEPIGVCARLEEVPVTLDEWRRSRSPFPVDSEQVRSYRPVMEQLLSHESREAVVQEAREALKGRIRCFSRWPASFGETVDWHRNPVRGVSWPARVHWSRVLSAEPRFGDVKLTWEVNRFPHVFALVRAWVLTGEREFIDGFCNQVRGWEEANPFRGGVNWASGQELAIRCIAWSFALHAFGEDDRFREEDFQLLMRLLRLHGRQLAAHIDYSRFAVHNNHLIGEALGLYLLGGILPFFPEAKRWLRIGRDLLERDCLRQFRPDGGYCQSSHNYHRLALHYLLWAWRLAELRGEPFGEPYRDVLRRSTDYLAAFLNEEDGRLPNWGANDGALLNPWTLCDYSDFRPLLQSLGIAVDRKRRFPEGPWDEEMLWLFGPEVLKIPLSAERRTSKSFPQSGLHVLRISEGDFAVLRCGTVADRFGQADQLHVDVWWKGQNVAMDGGSYLYNDELRFHRYFMGTLSHNTMTVDGQDQMQLYRRFKWLHWTRAVLLAWHDGSAGEQQAEGEHYGYLRLETGPVVHRRRLAAMSDGGWEVEDRMIPESSAFHEYRLHWLLPDLPNRFEEAGDGRSGVVELDTPRGVFRVRISIGFSEMERDRRLALVRGVENGVPEGWSSRYYGERVPALSFSAVARASGEIRFVSRFEPVGLSGKYR